MSLVRAYLGADEIHVDLFAGGGGASLGVATATGRAPDVAVNRRAGQAGGSYAEDVEHQARS